jgi:hypothetical protein
MIPIIASAVLSVAGQLAFKWISSAFSGDKATPAAATPRADAPKDEFAALLRQSGKSPEPAKAPEASPVVLASMWPVAPAGAAALLAPTAPGATSAPAPHGARAGEPSATGDLHSAADAYQRVQDWQSP